MRRACARCSAPFDTVHRTSASIHLSAFQRATFLVTQPHQPRWTQPSAALSQHPLYQSRQHPLFQTRSPTGHEQTATTIPTLAWHRLGASREPTITVGYPGISATLPRIEGKVEIRPAVGVSAPINVSLVTVSLQRRESINPTADSMIRSSLSSSRKEITDLVGKEMLLYRAPTGKESEAILCMDLPFVLFIPYGRGGEEVARRVPPASLQLDKRTAETFYEIVVMVQQGPQDQRKYPFAVPISRYDTLSTFGMYNRPESAEKVSDHIVTLGISLPRWSYGPLDPVSVYIKLSPNPEYMAKAKRVTIQSITVGIDEEIIFNHEGDEPKRNTKTLAKHTQPVGVRMPEAGYFTNLGLVFPGRDLRDNDGVLPRGKKEFPMYAVSGFTTTGTLYKIEYYLTVRAKMSSARDIILRQPIVVCPFDHAGCKEEMEAIEQAAKDAAHISPDNPMLPAAAIIKASDPAGFRPLGIAISFDCRRISDDLCRACAIWLRGLVRDRPHGTIGRAAAMLSSHASGALKTRGCAASGSTSVERFFSSRLLKSEDAPDLVIPECSWNDTSSESASETSRRTRVLNGRALNDETDSSVTVCFGRFPSCVHVKFGWELSFFPIWSIIWLLAFKAKDRSDPLTAVLPCLRQSFTDMSLGFSGSVWVGYFQVQRTIDRRGNSCIYVENVPGQPLPQSGDRELIWDDVAPIYMKEEMWSAARMSRPSSQCTDGSHAVCFTVSFLPVCIVEGVFDLGSNEP
nr:arrestin family protein 1 [Quercus suber]